MTTPATNVAADTSRSAGRTKEVQPVNDLLEHLREYAKERPVTVALWCLGIGFVLGWKLKPW